MTCSSLEILRATLRRLESDPDFTEQNPHARKLRRKLLLAIADLEEKQGGSAGAKPSARRVLLQFFPEIQAGN